jgi:diguanylate cyclase (GGDEF)-like protein
MDFDGFKMINDKQGHPIGDKVLIVFSDLVEKSFQEMAIFGRLGGDEFGLLTMDSSLDLQLTENKLQQIKNDLSVALGFPINISYGIEKCSDHNYKFDAIYRGADKKMYEAKAA